MPRLDFDYARALEIGARIQRRSIVYPLLSGSRSSSSLSDTPRSYLFRYAVHHQHPSASLLLPAVHPVLGRRSETRVCAGAIGTLGDQDTDAPETPREESAVTRTDTFVQSLDVPYEQAVPKVTEMLRAEGFGVHGADDARRSTLPAHAMPPRFVVSPTLRVDGLVRRVLDLRPADLLAFAQQEVAGDFTCLEGWTVLQLSWQGVPLRTVRDMAGVRAEARWLQASAGSFSVPLPIEITGTALLALRLGPEDLPVEHGGPIRLVVPGQACFTSVIWLDHLGQRAPRLSLSKPYWAAALGRLARR